MNNLQILPVWQILFLFLFASFETHKLFLFLFVQMLALQNYSYSYLQEKYLFAEHWNTIAQQTSQNTFSSKVETYKSEGQKASFLFFYGLKSVKSNTFQIRQGSPIDCKPFPMQLHHYAKSATFGKIAVTFKPVMQFQSHSG